MRLDSALLTFIALFGGLCLGGLILIGVIIPFIGHLFFGLEMYNLVVEAIGEFTGRPRLAQLGCLVVILLMFSCCCGALALGAGAITCFTSTPAQLCSLIGR